MTEPARRLEELGAAGPALDELLAYTENRCRMPEAPYELPLPDEAHLADWDEYAQEAQRDGVLPALRRRLVQLRFPIEAGISARPDYRAATRRGLWPSEDSPGVVLEKPEGVELSLCPTPAGRIPILTIGHRPDFETLVRAFTCRNEPEGVPVSMGACIVGGLNNWDRVARHRRRFEAALGGSVDEDAWAGEFRRLVPQKELYQDRFLLLSRGPYSAVGASDAGMAEPAWLEASVRIRRVHECFHFLTSRVLGSMRNSALDELLADFVGLVSAVGRYDDALARRFLGIEDHPRFRDGGRLANYRGDPPLSDAAFRVLCSLAAACTRSLRSLTERNPAVLTDHSALARAALDLYASGLTGLLDLPAQP